MMHYLVHTTQAELDQLKAGLSMLGVLGLMHSHPSLFRPLFLAAGKAGLSAESLLKLFIIDWSPVGSNSRELEEAVIFGWAEYVRNIQGVF